MIKSSILITTKNRLEDLQITLQKITHLLNREDVECASYDDGSINSTSEFLNEKHQNIQLLTNKKSKGYICNRNYLLNNCKGKYAISLDDDSNFLTENHFISNEKCEVIACRVFWGIEPPKSSHSNQVEERVNGFVGCGHVWNLKAWHSIPNYPEWHFFYGEEDFAGFQLLKKGIEIHYVLEILVHHKVNVSARKNDKYYQIIRRRSLRSAWYNYFIFYPISIIPKKMTYTIWKQIKNHTFKRNYKAILAMFQALYDVLLHELNFIKKSNRLTRQQFQ